MTTYRMFESFVEPFKVSPMSWVTLEFEETTVLPEKKAKCIKDYLRQKGIEVRKLPLEIGENIVYVRKKDFPLVQKEFSKIKLREICG